MIFKEFISSGQPNVFDRKELQKKLDIKLKGSGVGWIYQWSGNGMLSKVTLPMGSEVNFNYDPLGRRIAKQYKGKVTRWLWDGNVPLHEWQYEGDYPPKLSIDETDSLKETEEPTENVITWLFEENSFVPCGKIVGEEKYNIVCDYLGTPTNAYDRVMYQMCCFAYPVQLTGLLSSIKKKLKRKLVMFQMCCFV